MEVITITDIKENNKKSLFRLVLKYPDISRTELASKSGLSGGTITALVRELIDDEILEDSKLYDSTGGRPKRGLRVKLVESNILVVEVKQRKLNVKTFDNYNNLLSDTVYPTNYLNGNFIVETIVNHLNKIETTILKIGILIEENIVDTEISYLFSTGVSHSQISIEDALKMFTDAEVILDFSLKYSLDSQVTDLLLENVGLYGYININNLLTTSIYSDDKQLEFKNGLPFTFNLSGILEKIGYSSLWETLNNTDFIGEQGLQDYAYIKSSKMNACYKNFIKMLGDAIMSLQIFYPLDAIFLLNNGNNIVDLDEKIWEYVKKQPNNKLKLIKMVIPDKSSIAKNMNRELLLEK